MAKCVPRQEMNTKAIQTDFSRTHNMYAKLAATKPDRKYLKFIHQCHLLKAFRNFREPELVSECPELW